MDHAKKSGKLKAPKLFKLGKSKSEKLVMSKKLSKSWNFLILILKKLYQVSFFLALEQTLTTYG